MMTPKAIRVLAAYFEATEALADSTEKLLARRLMARSGQIGNTQDWEEIVQHKLAIYRQARAEYEAL